ncbi:tetratricopeptide repeat protein [Candidatus Sumerlaeota bacterium]|nr:tetratricopeptide repeat protein [Candidatus Sumerlaeota bacterium]
MKLFRTLMSITLVLALTYMLYIFIPVKIYAEWSSRLGIISYVAYPLFLILCFVIVDTVLGRILAILDKFANLSVGFFYGVHGRENRILAKRAFFNTLFFRNEEAAGCFMNSGLYIHAAKCFERAGNHASAAEAYHLAKEYQKAAGLFMTVKKYVSAGECYIKLGDHASAAKAYHMSGEKLVMEGKILMAAEAYLKAREYQAAAELFEKSGHPIEAAETYEKSGDSLKAAELYLKAGQEESIRQQKHATYEPEFRTNDKVSLYAEKAGDLYLKLEHWDKAIEAFEIMGDHQRIAEIFIRKGDMLQAAQIYEKYEIWNKAKDCYDRLGLAMDVLRMDAHQALQNRLWQRAALLFEELHDYQKALEIYREIRDDAGQAHCLEKLGRPLAAANYYLKTKNLAKAAELYEQVGNFKEAAELYRELGQPDKEYSCIARSGNPFHSATLERERGNLEKAIDILRSVEHFSPDYKSSMLLMAQCYLDLDRPALAADAFERVIPSITPNENNIENFYLYACILEKTENYNYALDLFQKVDSIKKDYKDVLERVSLLKTILSNKLKINIDDLIRKKQSFNHKEPEDKPYDKFSEIPSSFDGINDLKTILEDGKTVIEEPDTAIENPDSTDEIQP